MRTLGLIEREINHTADRLRVVRLAIPVSGFMEIRSKEADTCQALQARLDLLWEERRHALVAIEHNGRHAGPPYKPAPAKLPKRAPRRRLTAFEDPSRWTGHVRRAYQPAGAPA